jgi:hypothetical protein
VRAEDATICIVSTNKNINQHIHARPIQSTQSESGMLHSDKTNHHDSNVNVQCSPVETPLGNIITMDLGVNGTYTADFYIFHTNLLSVNKRAFYNAGTNDEANVRDDGTGVYIGINKELNDVDETNAINEVNDTTYFSILEKQKVKNDLFYALYLAGSISEPSASIHFRLQLPPTITVDNCSEYERPHKKYNVIDVNDYDISNIMYDTVTSDTTEGYVDNTTNIHERKISIFDEIIVFKSLNSLKINSKYVEVDLEYEKSMNENQFDNDGMLDADMIHIVIISCRSLSRYIEAEVLTKSLLFNRKYKSSKKMIFHLIVDDGGKQYFMNLFEINGILKMNDISIVFHSFDIVCNGPLDLFFEKIDHMKQSSHHSGKAGDI